MKIITVDPSKFEVYDQIYEVDPKIVDGVYYKSSSGDYLFAAFCFPVESKPKLQELMDRLRNFHEKYKTEEARILYQELPKLQM